MSRIQAVVQVGLTSIGFDEPRLHIDCDMKPTQSLADWMQRRGRVARAWPAIQGDRSYQTEIIQKTRVELAAKRNPIIVAGCGAGKSWVACKIAQRAVERGRAIGFITVRRALVHDLTERLTSFGVPHGIIMPGYEDNQHRTKLASVHTMAARGTTLDVDCLFIDEAHTFLGAEFQAVIDRHAGIPRVMMTATPWTGKGYGLGRIGDSFVMGPSTDDLISGGFLVSTRIFTRDLPDTSSLDVNSSGEYNEPQLEALMSRPAIMGNLVKEWLFRAKNLPTVVHAVNIAHADRIVKRFQDAGVNAVRISAETPDAERKRVFDDMCAGSPPKQQALLLDLAGNVAERFGAPESPREWTLDDSDPKAAHKAVLGIRRCDKCWFTYASHSQKCPECKNPHVPTVREVREKAAALVEYKRQKKEESLEKLRETGGDHVKAKIMAGFLKKAKESGYARGWAFGRYKGVFKESATEEIIRAAYHLMR